MSIRFATRMILSTAALVAVPAAAQVLGGVLGGGGGGGPVGGVIGTVDRTVGEIGQVPRDPAALPAGQRQRVRDTLDYVGSVGDSVSAPGLLELRALRRDHLVRANPRGLDRDPDGNPVRRDILIAIAPSAAELQIAQRLGFTLAARSVSPELGLTMVSLAVPRGMRVRAALASLRQATPGMTVDYDHIFEPAGAALDPAVAALAGGAASGAAAAGAVRIAMVDGGVASHPSLARAAIEQKGFSGAAAATGHGTAVASLLVGQQGAFRGAAPGAQLFVADIYGGNPAAGSASAIVRALAWAASKRPALITMSLAGPANRLLAQAVGALQRRGIAVVAAVGNDGPAAPPAYPASYPGVVAITGVDARGRALMEAGRATDLDFAAPGADLAAALPGKGYARVRGTSFATPLAAARLALAGSTARLAAEARPGKGRVGRGIVCATCAVPPRAVGAR